MIATSIQWIGWTKPPAGPEKQAPPVAQTAPTTPSLDPGQVQQMTQNLAALREMVQQLTAGQDQTTREIAKLEAAVAGTNCEDPRASGAAVRCACAQAHAGAAVIASADSTAVGTDTNTPAAVSKSHPSLSCRSYRPNAPIAELVRLSRTSIADEMRI
jgi:hypothetical protein